MLPLLQLLQRLKSDERGISAIEYAILAGVLVVVIVGLVMAFGGEIGGLFGGATEALQDAQNGGGTTTTPANPS